jgi:hypothetical protein
MKTKNLMIGLVAAAALAQVGIGAANAKVVMFTYTTSNTLVSAGGNIYGGINNTLTPTSSYFTVDPTSGAGTQSTPDNFTLFEITPTTGGSGKTQFIDTFNANVDITDRSSGKSGVVNFENLGFSGNLSPTSDKVDFLTLKQYSMTDPITQTLDLGNYVYTITLTGETNPGTNTPGEISGKITAMKASPAPEPSEVGMLVLCTVGLMGLMVRARKARAVGGTTM